MEYSPILVLFSLVNVAPELNSLPKSFAKDLI